MILAIILLILTTTTVSGSQCSWTESLDTQYASEQLKNTLHGHAIKIHLTKDVQSYKKCIEQWLDKSKIVQQHQSVDLWAKMSLDRSYLILQTKKDGIQIQLPQNKTHHYLTLLLCLLILVINNIRRNEVSFTQIIDAVNDLIHLLHNQQNQDLVLNSQNIKKLKHLSTQLNSSVKTKFYFKVDSQRVGFQTLKSEVSIIVKECLSNKNIESSTRKLYLKTLSKYSSYCYLNFASLLNDRYPLAGDIEQSELSFFYTNNTNWDYHQQQLQSIMMDWMDITYDNAKQYSKDHSAGFIISNEVYPKISISNPAILDIETAILIKQQKAQELSKKKRRGTGYPKLLCDITKYNDTLKRSRQNMILDLELKQDKLMVTASLNFKTKIDKSKGLNILIIDDDAHSKYFQHQQIDDCLKSHDITIIESFVNCTNIQDEYDLILMDRNFPLDDPEGDFVTRKEMQILSSKFNPDKTYLVSTDSNDCEDLFLDSHILSIRNLLPIINDIHQAKQAQSKLETRS